MNIHNLKLVLLRNMHKDITYCTVQKYLYFYCQVCTVQKYLDYYCQVFEVSGPKKLQP